PLDQTNQLYHNTGGARFEEVTDRAGAVFKLAEVSRGSAFGDVDNDGDTDILVFNNNGPVRLLLNHTGNRQPWVGLLLIGTAAGRDMLGARVAVRRVGAPTLWRRVASDGSYCSANDPRVLVGLGTSDQVTAVQVYWPDGRREQWQGLSLQRYTTLRQGTGQTFE
ncbi:MAG: CRTAC1 family protein, partial [Planctomycetota bacterium]